MSRRDEYVAAVLAGQDAELGARNPYATGDRPVLARLWRRGYQRMLLERVYSGPAMQVYLDARRQAR
jgi:hypothetical protein